jgi:hypothetical protein
MFSKRQHSEEDLRAAKRSRVGEPEIILSQSGTSKRSYEPENNDREAKRSKTQGDGALLGRGGTIKRQHEGEGDAHDIYNPEKYTRRIPKYKVIGYEDEAGYYLVEITYSEITAHALVLDKDLDTQCPDYTRRLNNIFGENRTLSHKNQGHTPTHILTVAAHSPFGMCGAPPQWDSLSRDPDMSSDHVATILFSAWMLIEWSDGVRTWEPLRELHYGPFDRYEIYSQLANAAKENENRFRTLSRIQHYDRHGYPGREKVFGVVRNR